MKFEIIYDDQSFSVLYEPRTGVLNDVGYGDKHTAVEDYAYMIQHLLQLAGAEVTVREV